MVVTQELRIDKHLPIFKVVSELYLTKHDPETSKIEIHFVKLINVNLNEIQNHVF
jgi:hypothetical protein